MSLEGRLEDLSLPDIFQIINLSKRSGVLTVLRKEGTGRLVFNQGQVIQASSDSKGRLGYTLVRKGIIANEDLENGLRIQKVKGSKKPLGTVLVEMEALSREVLEKELKEHIIEVIRDLLGWEHGSFHFELSSMGEEEIVLKTGLSTEFLLLEATRLQDEDTRQHELEKTVPPSTAKPAPSLKPQGPVQPAASGSKGAPETVQSKGAVAQKPTVARKDLQLLTMMISELSGPTSSSEITLLILRFAGEIMNRALIFLTRKEDILGLGQSGIVLPGGNVNERIRNIRIPLAEESIFKTVLEKRSPYKGKLPKSNWNQFLVEQLGGEWPSEVYVAPLMSEGRVIAILYGDNLHKQEAIGETEGLEAFIKVAGFAFGRALLERRLQGGRS
jgi:Domain of unknown function (DUF4388)